MVDNQTHRLVAVLDPILKFNQLKIRKVALVISKVVLAINKAALVSQVVLDKVLKCKK
jgi:hypothetical protein